MIRFLPSRGSPAAMLALVLLLPGPGAHAQGLDSREAIALQNQIAELRRDINGLRDRLAATGAAGGTALGSQTQVVRPGPAVSSDLTTSLLERVQALEEEIRTLRGRSENQGFALERLTADTKKGFEDLEYRLQASPPAGSATASQARPGSPPTAPLVPVPPQQAAARPTADALLKESKDALAARDYPTAERAGRRFVADYPREPRRQEALFTVGESLFARRDFAQAALVFDDAFRASQTGARAAESRIRTGESLVSLGERAAACQAFDSAASQFSDMRAELRSRLSAGRTRANCR